MSALWASLLSVAFLAQVARRAVPYVLAALGGAVTERAGVVDLALEAKLLFGAFAAAAVGHATGSALAGAAGGAAAGALVAAAQLALAVGLGAEQVIVGVGLNLAALGGTRLLLQVLYGQSANSPPAPSLGDAVLANPLVLLAATAAVLVPLAVARTRWGLRLRAAGDRPGALVAVGARPARARTAAALVGGALAGAGGAQLALAVGGFSAEMSSGRGYLALVAVILAGWRPRRAALVCVGIAAAEALTTQLQITGATASPELAALLPYALTLAVLVVAGGGGRTPPAALGKG